MVIFNLIGFCEWLIFSIYKNDVFSWKTRKLASALSVPPCKIKSFIHSFIHSFIQDLILRTEQSKLCYLFKHIAAL